MERPAIEQIASGKEFNKWYWLKHELVAICKLMNLPIKGNKFELRDRIMNAIDHGEALRPTSPSKKTSSMNWAKATLSVETRITDTVSFGPNFRRFMKSQIGDKFVCNAEFMAWVKSNVGASLADAIDHWHALEARKENAGFRKEIAPSNMYNQYTRDFIDDNPGTTIKEARACWMVKKERPTDDGVVRYDSSDLQFLRN